MKPVNELSDTEANKRLTELLGSCWHESPVKGGYQDVCVKCHYVNPELKNQNKPYATSYDEIIPALQSISNKKPHGLYIRMEANWTGYLYNKIPIQFTWVDFMKKTPRELLNAAIEALEWR